MNISPCKQYYDHMEFLFHIVRECLHGNDAVDNVCMDFNHRKILVYPKQPSSYYISIENEHITVFVRGYGGYAVFHMEHYSMTTLLPQIFHALGRCNSNG